MPEMPGIRPFLLSLPDRLQILIVVGVTVASAFAAALTVRALFGVKLLTADIGLTIAVYEVFGTIYAVLLAFVVSGSWQNFSVAVRSVRAEASALSDLVHIVDSFPTERTKNIRCVAVSYARLVIEAEWQVLAGIARGHLTLEDLNHDAIQDLVEAVQFLEPENAREAAVFEQALVMLNNWLDARRDRLQSAGGGHVAALWPLLIAGAMVLFAFHGLFVAQAAEVWVALLLGLSMVVGLSFYLIFSLDSPFTGRLSAHAAPFQWVINWCQRDKPLGHREPGTR